MEPHQYWQNLFQPGHFDTRGPFRDLYPAALPDGRQLALPIRRLPDASGALASLIVSQASFAVLDALADVLAAKLRPAAPDIVVGLPTLGLTLAAAVAQKLGHTRYLPLGTSRKFWYEERLSVPLNSITTPDMKRLYLDPRLLPLLDRQRVALIDDVISTGTSIIAGVSLLAVARASPIAMGCAMLQSTRWRGRGCARLPDWQARVAGVFETPLLVAEGDAWRAAG